MGSSEQILVIPEDFKAALEKYEALIDEVNSAYKKIVSSNANLAAAWEGESASKFREQATIVENVFSKNIESLRIILLDRLQYSLDKIVEQDLIIANCFNNNPFAQSIYPNLCTDNNLLIDVDKGKVEKNEGSQSILYKH